MDVGCLLAVGLARFVSPLFTHHERNRDSLLLENGLEHCHWLDKDHYISELYIKFYIVWLIISKGHFHYCSKSHGTTIKIPSGDRLSLKGYRATVKITRPFFNHFIREPCDIRYRLYWGFIEFKISYFQPPELVCVDRVGMMRRSWGIEWQNE
ncbi:hypothetical protein BofuT4_P163540.1 [Botrytis cinerea T4]|uniref:Uncharacterized protein n=1 Tax=Botryotinia fuckeliana (strain T4) TaxID=999810 RepID=G2YTG1_BOTF4|nr:hypothetical protein BofuT4_P163540.1 [Botrytis cinerea T4]